MEFKNSPSKLLNFFFNFYYIYSISNYNFLVPETQNKSRSLIRTSNVDFIDTFVKPRKFNDNINGLTIYAEEKLENGTLKNLYLKKMMMIKILKLRLQKKGY